MSMYQKILLGVGAVVVLFALSFCGYYTWRYYSGNFYSESAIEDAYEKGRLEAEGYRQYISGLIFGLERDIADSGTGKLTDLDVLYRDILDISSDVGDVSLSVEALAAKKRQTLESLRGSLVSMRTSYESERVSLSGRLTEVRASISHLIVIGGAEADISSLRLIEEYLAGQLVAVDSLIFQLTGHIADIDTQLQNL